ncbi:hypothetical protein UQ28_23460, partial [Escherichia coli]
SSLSLYFRLRMARPFFYDQPLADGHPVI